MLNGSRIKKDVPLFTDLPGM